MRKTIISCDIDKCNNTITEIVHKGFQVERLIPPKSISVIFTTEQTEGRSCEPYVESIILDICSDCMKKYINGDQIRAKGAQEHNVYYFKSAT